MSIGKRSVARKKTKPKTKETRRATGNIGPFLLYRLGLTDDDTRFGWKLSSLNEIRKKKIIQPDFGEAVATAVAERVHTRDPYSCVNYFRYAGTFQLANQRTLTALSARCDKVAKCIGRHHKEIAISRALSGFPHHSEAGESRRRYYGFRSRKP